MVYEDWKSQVDFKSKHRRLQPEKSAWNHAATIIDQFAQLFEHHRHSILVVSYRDDGIPSKQQLLDLLHQFKPQVYQASQPNQYVLSTKKSSEILLIAF